MAALTLYTKIETLPSNLKAEAKKFIEELVESNQVNKSAENKKARIFGSLSGKIHLSDDFDSPLEDFKDYM